MCGARPCEQPQRTCQQRQGGGDRHGRGRDFESEGEVIACEGRPAGAGQHAKIAVVVLKEQRATRISPGGAEAPCVRAIARGLEKGDVIDAGRQRDPAGDGSDLREGSIHPLDRQRAAGEERRAGRLGAVPCVDIGVERERVSKVEDEERDAVERARDRR
jgi:hypothetical protein